MHELGVVFEVIKAVDKVADEAGVDEIGAIVLQIGELSSMIPMYVENCFPAATYEKPRYANTKLEIEVIPGEAQCNECGEIFNVKQYEGYCPTCNSFDKRLLRGREFILKEIRV